MLRVNAITLVQFRNYASSRFDFTERIIGICGANGTGKTNLLDAIHYLSFTRSYFSRADSQNVQHGQQGLRIEGAFQLNEQAHSLVCILRENNKKEFSTDGQAYRKFSDHLGRFPSVIIAPDDTHLISGGGEDRRNFLDAILCQINPQYLQQLISYNKLLQQRNSFLKQVAESGSMPDQALLEILNEQLSAAGQYIYAERNSFLQQFIPLVQRHYLKIAGQDDAVVLQYESQLHGGSMLQLLQQRWQKDLAVQRTSAGIHRDDIAFQMHQLPFKSQASQGQRKSLLFALKLAEWVVLKEKKGFAPILLLDDVFEKLDALRMQNLLHWVCAENEGQVFITDTHKERLSQHLSSTGVSFQLIAL